jgi:alanyl-tRNA synthetase
LEKGISLDLDGYEKAMASQRERARSAARFSQKVGEDTLAQARMFSLPGESSRYRGYERDEIETKISKVYVSASGELLGLVLAETPFYVESGGQVDDQGVITGRDFGFEVESLTKRDGEIVHLGGMVKAAAPTASSSWEGLLGQTVLAAVYSATRRATERNHTATHLLHAALRQVLGSHVHQQGSLVAPDRLRFDFTHLAPVSRDELDRIEALVNECIRANSLIKTDLMSLEEARKSGAMALFGEKYEDKVRVVQVPGFSMELCGGTHVRATGEIGLFLIAGESGIASGVRRIEAVTGKGAYRTIKQNERVFSELCARLAVSLENLPVRVAKLVEENAELRKRLEKDKSRASLDIVEDLVKKAEVVGGVRVVIAQVECDTNDRLREMGDLLRKGLGSGVGVLASVLGGKAAFVATVSEDVVGSSNVTAGELAKRLGQAVGGTGGGRPQLAQAGGKDFAKIPEALEAIRKHLHSKV